MKRYEKLQRNAVTQYERAIVAILCAMASQTASAQTTTTTTTGGGDFSLPGFSDLGCKVINWLTGELSVMIFFIIVIVTLLVGFFAKMDWTKILGVIVFFGLLQGATKLFSGFITTSISCLAG
jgi:type IV secretory pathway VirB2 component (pilin)